MRVALIVRQYLPGLGGLERFVAALARELAALGCTCEVITLDRLFHGDGRRLPADERVGGVRVRRVGKVGVRRYFVPRLPAGLLRDYDVLHVHGIDGFFERVAAHRLRPGQVRIATTHGAFFHTPFLAPLKRAYLALRSRPLARRYQAVLANSAHDRGRFAGCGAPVVQLPNGVRPLSAARATGSDVLVLGRLASHKRVEAVLRAFAAEPLRRAGRRLHVVGPDGDRTAAKLRAEAARLGVGARVVVHGPLSDDALAEVVRSCAVFASASTFEGFGMALVEAMSSGLVPVVEPNPSARELLGEAGVGHLVSFDHAERAAAAIEAAAAVPGLEAQRAAAAAFGARFGWRAHAEATLRVYREALGRQAAAPGGI